MKKLLFIVPLLIAFGCSKSVEEETLIEKDGLKYLPDAEIPYTGPVISLNDKGKKRSDGHYKEGKREGLFTTWVGDKVKFIETNYKDGNMDGLSTAWFPDGGGDIRGKIHYKNGKKDGLHTYWYKNGQKEEEGHNKIGFKIGKWTKWDENGNKKEEWSRKDSGSFQTLWHDNGQKMQEGNFNINGIMDGLWTHWYSDGELYAKRTYKDGVKQSETMY